MLASICLFACVLGAPAHAETYHTCSTVIASLPTVITTQGVYCLSHDLSTAITSGNAIDIQSNNVTLDCNGYKIGGLAAGNGSTAVGVYADTRQNITVRNCGIRGYYDGIFLKGSGAGHVVEDNRLDNTLLEGITVYGDNNTVRRNRVYDTGGYSAPGSLAIGVGISAQADIIDNTVSGVFTNATDSYAFAILINGKGNEARGNRVSGLVSAGSGAVVGIQVNGSGDTIRDNSFAATDSTVGYGIEGNDNVICTGNMISKFSTAMSQCQDGGGNASY
jgi:parallel beta-helix repeat protein